MYKGCPQGRRQLAGALHRVEPRPQRGFQGNSVMMMGSSGRPSAVYICHRLGAPHLPKICSKTHNNRLYLTCSSENSVRYRDGARKEERWAIAATILREGLNPLSILNGGDRFVVAEVGGQLAGFGQVRPLSDQAAMEMASMVVREPYR